MASADEGDTKAKARELDPAADGAAAVDGDTTNAAATGAVTGTDEEGLGVDVTMGSSTDRGERNAGVLAAGVEPPLCTPIRQL
jgi:hypothetical protein